MKKERPTDFNSCNQRVFLFLHSNHRNELVEKFSVLIYRTMH